jgi:hypothetical protein
MNYQQNGMLSGLLPQQDTLARLMEYLYQQRQEPMLTGPMMLAQGPNQLQQMVGVRGDGVSSQTKAAIEKELPGFYGTKAPVPEGPKYTPGTDAFSGGRTLRPGYERFGPMNDAEFKALLEMRRKN